MQTKGVRSLEEHPVKRLYDAGVHVTLNTDNRTVSGTTLLKGNRPGKKYIWLYGRRHKRMEGYAAEAAFLDTVSGVSIQMQSI